MPVAVPAVGDVERVPGSLRNQARVPHVEAPQTGAALRKSKYFFVSNVTIHCVHVECKQLWKPGRDGEH